VEVLIFRALTENGVIIIMPSPKHQEISMSSIKNKKTSMPSVNNQEISIHPLR
jgi:hypothetical protein